MSNNLTIEQIQAVIDKGGCLISDENEIHFGEITIDGDILKQKYSLMFSYVISESDWREATPEEIEKYVPVEYRQKQETKDKVHFFAIDPDLIRSDVQHEVFTKSDLISFGNYLLSKEREEMVTSKPERGVNECAIVIRQVSDADFENWRVK